MQIAISGVLVIFLILIGVYHLRVAYQSYKQKMIEMTFVFIGFGALMFWLAGFWIVWIAKHWGEI